MRNGSARLGLRVALCVLTAVGSVVLAVAPAAAVPSGRMLDIYFIDVEGGQSTLLVTPDRQSLLIDTGWAAAGSNPSAKPADPVQARDAQRILAAARDAGVRQIDFLLITHFHPDHDGGVTELSQLLPIRHFIDHGTLLPEALKDANLKASFDSYAAVRSKGEHIDASPGYRIPLRDLEAIVVSSAGATISTPLTGAGETNSTCAPKAPAARDPLENPRSTGLVARFGKFRFLDLGDLSGQPLFDLACPRNKIGPVDLYLVAHHGGPDAADPATFAAFNPRVALLNNGMTKGGARETYETLHHTSVVEDVWQLHRSESAGDLNFAPDHIANLDENTAYWIKVSASEDGSFRVINTRTRASKFYTAR